MITRAQLRSVGLGRGAIDHRLRVGRLHSIHRGVYLLGHRSAGDATRLIAAVLACGPRALLSHVSAAGLWGLLTAGERALGVEGLVDVTVPERHLDSKPGLRLHCVATLPRDEVRMRSGIPLTSPARTILDLAGEVPERVLEQALAHGQARGLVRADELQRLLARHRGNAGTRALRDLTESNRKPALTRSQAEERLLGMIRAAGLPEPEVNGWVGRHEVDFLWRAERLVVEVDGFGFHSSRGRFEHDRIRDAELLGQGLAVMRVTWRQLVDSSEATLVRVARALERRSGFEPVAAGSASA